MPSIWPFSGPSNQASPSSSPAHTKATEKEYEQKHPNTAGISAAEMIPPLVIVEGFLSAAQSVVWGNEFRTYLGIGHQQLVEQLPPSTTPTSPCTQSSASHVSASPTGSYASSASFPHACNMASAQHSKHKGQSRRSGFGSARKVVFAPIGPVSSIHDRACELFYALRGGTVDYGSEHAKLHGHSRWGRHYDEGLCPGWGKHMPAHFLGHSLGGPTILKLQQLLRQGFFNAVLGISTLDRASGEGTEGLEGDVEAWRAEDLILSITSVSSPFRGTPLVYSLGSEPLPYPKVRMFSFGDILSKLVHLAAWADLPWFDAHADAWHFSARRRKAIRSKLAGGVEASANSAHRDTEAGLLSDQVGVRKRNEAQNAIETDGREELRDVGLKGLLVQLWKSDWAGGKDCAPWDCTFAERENDSPHEGWGLDQAPHLRQRKTWYRSYAGGMTISDDDSVEKEAPAFHRPQSYLSLSPLTFTSHLIGHFDYSRLQPSPSFLPQPFLTDKMDMSENRNKTMKDGLAMLTSAWWENDGVVPLASQFHPLDCDQERCRHFQGMRASLPFGQRVKRPQSTDFRLHVSSPEPLSPVSETATLVHITQGHPEFEKVACNNANQTEEQETMMLLPPPATHKKGEVQISRSILGSAKSIARVAYSTTLRAINVHDPPLLTPSDDELRTFLPDFATPSNEGGGAFPSSLSYDTHCAQTYSQMGQGTMEERAKHENPQEFEKELLEPHENKWYTFEIENLDHTSLCPFWTGSEIQKQFWTGIGFYLASVDRLSGYPITNPSSTSISSSSSMQ
ncbi:related to lipase [Melanopsichium pennsylvanicum]|uniref:Related to lipase n=2 Tax=Melanopsichium pennsylvanicum TaxID=63383 RepID=A0AAJ5C4Y1_9BASI|nr:related to lipase [Melanopsichium pennsylvanicum 4]SNX84152.1 related to lipase [Melanopsichium pennsylvanicum]